MSTETKASVRQPNVTTLAWLIVNFLWLTVIFLTDVPAWTLAVWIAATIGLGAFQRSGSD